MSDAKIRVYVGWDSREDIAFQVCKHSILKNAKRPNDIEVIPLKQKELRKDAMYWRDIDALGSTEFTFTRFLVPELAGFDGWAIFIDCDFLFLDDIEKLYNLRDDRYALMCVKHDYTPAEGEKMDGQKQLPYPRKNWSSMMLFNCGHPANRQVTKELVNDSNTTGQYLHRFQWLSDSQIGTISHRWNWLVGWYQEPKHGSPKALHYTEGGPWFKEYQKCEYAVDWLLVEREYIRKEHKERLQNAKAGPFDQLSDEKVALLHDALQYSIDPNNYYFDSNLDTIKDKVEKMGNKVATIDSVGGISYQSKGLDYDPYLVDFVHGSGGFISDWDREKDTDNALVIRGLGGGSRKAIQHCWETGREFYAIDTGYFGNGKTKTVHRVSHNALQQLGPIIERPDDRARRFGYKFRKYTPGTKILLVPPSNKVMDLFGQPSPEEWVKQVTAELKRYTDRPIEVRLKPTRTDRVTTKSIQAALADDVHCLITYNSIAAVEALMEGKPAIVLGQNAATTIAETELKNIENPRFPSKDEMNAFINHLAYCQFTIAELRSGYAWRTVNESSQLPLWNPTKK
jgi:lipopolysaccharide biosynthesis glycosyltransferase